MNISIDKPETIILDIEKFAFPQRNFLKKIFS